MKETRNILILFCVFMGVVFVSSTVSVRAGRSPLADIKETVEGVLKILRDPEMRKAEMTEVRRSRMREVVYKRFDFEEMSRRSVGRYWRKFSPDEKAEFINLFGRLLESTYIGRIEGYTNEKVEYLSEKIDGEYSIVRTSIVLNSGTEVPINYKLILKEGQWRIYDVQVEGVSLVNNYRSQFRSILRRNPPSYLIQKIKDKLQHQNRTSQKG